MMNRFFRSAGGEALNQTGKTALVAVALFASACAGPIVERKGAETPKGESPKVVLGEKRPFVVMVTSKGKVAIKLLPDSAPKTVANFIELATGKKTWTDPATAKPTERPLYDGTIFHRVIPDFMIQGGDPTGTGIGGPGYTFPDEFSTSHPMDRGGLVAMANSGPNTNGSQFFITVVATPWLTNKHTVFGEVTDGLDVVRAITMMPRDANDRPLERVVIQEVRIEYR